VREAISPDGMMPDDAPRHVARVLAGFDPSIRLEKLDLSKTFTNEFAKKAKGRFKA
jgi:NitT/TauT family transport system substrate-binding protein